MIPEKQYSKYRETVKFGRGDIESNNAPGYLDKHLQGKNNVGATSTKKGVDHKDSGGRQRSRRQPERKTSG